MLRIVGGSAKGRKLKAPSSKRLRPTSERVREALFDILGPTVEGAFFLDLFAGTGAVGIEALSRGAEKVVLVEKNRRNCMLIRDNLIRCGIDQHISLWTRDALNVIESDRFKPFDIIFIDPPYNTDLVNSCLARLNRIAGKVKTVAIEQSVRPPETTFQPRHLHHIKDYRYGDTVLSLFKGMAE